MSDIGKVAGQAFNAIRQALPGGSKPADSSKPSSISLPKALTTRLDAAEKDFKLSFGTIKSILKSPFQAAFGKCETKMDVAENVVWGAILPATVPLSIMGAGLLLPLTLVSGLVSFAAGKSTQEMVKPSAQDKIDAANKTHQADAARIDNL